LSGTKQSSPEGL